LKEFQDISRIPILAACNVRGLAKCIGKQCFQGIYFGSNSCWNSFEEIPVLRVHRLVTVVNVHEPRVTNSTREVVFGKPLLYPGPFRNQRTYRASKNARFHALCSNRSHSWARPSLWKWGGTLLWAVSVEEPDRSGSVMWQREINLCHVTKPYIR
jgi:hypothetical protein